jgi:UDPglucose 6-dehydrogenase
MSVESAEMAKHTLNAYLATSIAFTNEVASICERVGADAAEVEQALRSEPRIGPRAYVRAGPAFAGGTLARDVRYLTELAEARRVPARLLSSVLPSNADHALWVDHQLERVLGDLSGKTVAVLGLAYKPGTDSTRRSAAVALCRRLMDRGAHVRAADPRVRELPADLVGEMALFTTAIDASEGCDAIVVATEWPEFAVLTPERVCLAMKAPFVIDQNGFLPALAGDPRIRYITLGRAS